MLRGKAPATKPRNNVTVVPLRMEARRSSNSSHSSRTKIKLVSPHASKNHLQPSAPQKQNDPSRPFLELGCSQPTSPSKYVTLGGKPNRSTSQNRSMGAMVPNTAIVNRTSIQKKSNQLQLPTWLPKNPKARGIEIIIQRTPPLKLAQNPPRSPQKIYLNNNLVQSPSLKVLNSPKICQKSESANQRVTFKSNQSSVKQSQPGTQLLIQQRNTIQSLKAEYQKELVEIKQLQVEIKQNNNQIKELLRESETSKKLSKVGSMESQNQFSIMGDTSQVRSPRAHTAQSGEFVTPFSKKTLVNDLKIPTNSRIDRASRCSRKSNDSYQSRQRSVSSHSKPQRDSPNSFTLQKISGQVSVQTDHFIQNKEEGNASSLTNSRSDKFSLTRNQQCQVKVKFSPPREATYPLLTSRDSNFNKMTSSKAPSCKSPGASEKSREKSRSPLKKSKTEFERPLSVHSTTKKQSSPEKQKSLIQNSQILQKYQNIEGSEGVKSSAPSPKKSQLSNKISQECVFNKSVGQNAVEVIKISPFQNMLEINKIQSRSVVPQGLFQREEEDYATSERPWAQPWGYTPIDSSTSKRRQKISNKMYL